MATPEYRIVYRQRRAVRAFSNETAREAVTVGNCSADDNVSQNQIACVEPDDAANICVIAFAINAAGQFDILNGSNGAALHYVHQPAAGAADICVNGV